MKTLIIHPNDPTTDFLCEIYENLDCKILRDDFDNLLNEIRNHDRIIMLGHGSSDGLFYKNIYVINEKYINLLKHKFCICIWCNANLFVNKYGLHGFYSDMVISDYNEALDYCIDCDEDDIINSNKLLASSLKYSINCKNILYNFRCFYYANNNVVKFNYTNFNQNEDYIEITELDYVAYDCYIYDLKHGIDYGGTIIPSKIEFKLNSIEFNNSKHGFFNNYYKEYYDKAKILLRKNKINKICS